MRSSEQTAGPSWTIHELLGRACEELRRRPSPPADPRARAMPDLRTLRYYLAEGLVSPPCALRGRVGLYGPLQLHELLAIKRLQALGRSLGEIRDLLARASEATIAEWSVPAPAPAPRRSGARQDIALAPGVRLVTERPVGIRPRDRRRLLRSAARLLREIRAQQRRERGDR